MPLKKAFGDDYLFFNILKSSSEFTGTLPANGLGLDPDLFGRDIDNVGREPVVFSVCEQIWYDWFLSSVTVGDMEDNESSNNTSVEKEEEEEAEEEVLKKKISNHPLYGLLVDTHLECLKEAYSCALRELKEALEQPQKEAIACIDSIQAQLRELTICDTVAPDHHQPSTSSSVDSSNDPRLQVE
ncbi:uncharacterized protein LOC120016708 [Tripterygium wilfordii]|uniref:uncharacterized protein LOC120016708 n=1 Tax=Tripterygium wilfordii TaxID=458696 RepID=UPI0018F85B6E|nr:uncharacterized protein LOC120016708 [Tripterygium wilfordii]